ncbi:MAG: quercetin 2,3-dioxygenase [Terracidiphilus sp.]
MKPQIVGILDHSPVETSFKDALQPALTNRAQPNLVRHLPAGTGLAYWGPGERMTFLATGKETSGAFFLAEIEVAPGGGTPPHIHHREDEAFHLLEGSLTIQVGGNTITASAGDFAFLPRGIAHSFKNDGDGCAKALVLTTPAGLEGFFAEVFDPATDRFATPPPQSKNLIPRALAAAPKYGLELLPPA